MKKKLLIGIVLLVLISVQARAQSTEVQQLLLNVEKLAQFKKVLKDMEEGYEILKNGYNHIRDISKGNFGLHRLFLDGLLKVNPAVRNYHKVASILSMQKRILELSIGHTGDLVRQGGFDPKELEHLENLYSKVLQGCLEELGELTMVLSAGRAKMDDGERLRTIDSVHERMERHLRLIRSLTASNSILEYHRQREWDHTGSMKSLQGITNR